MLAIIEGMRPSLRAGDFDAALQRAVVDTGVVLNGGRLGATQTGSPALRAAASSFLSSARSSAGLGGALPA